MYVKTIASALIVAVLGFSLGLPGTALAGDRKHDRHGSGHSGGHGYKRHYGHNRPHYRGHHYRPYYRPYYGHRGHRGYGGNYYYDDDDYDELLFGLVTGGILGYTLSQGQQNQRYAYPPPPRYAPY